MTTRDQVHKWFFYALGLVPIWVLDAFVLNRIAPFGVIPMLLPLAVAAVAVLEGAYAGTGFGLAVGLLWEHGVVMWGVFFQMDACNRFEGHHLALGLAQV